MKTMKHIFAMAAAIVVASAFTACTNDAVMNEEAPVQEEQEKVSLTVTATQGTRTPDTRLLYTDPNNGTGITVNWGTSEKLGVVNYDGVTVPTITDEDPTLAGTSDGNSNTMNFSGVVNASSGTMEGKYNFYYPTLEGGFATSGTDDTTGNAYISMNYNPQYCDLDDPIAHLSDRNLMYTTTAVDPSATGITLKHAAALLRFNLTLPEGAGTALGIYLSTWKPVLKMDAYLYYDEKGKATLEYKNDDTMFVLGLLNDKGTGARTITAYMLLPKAEDFTNLLCKVSVSDVNDNYFSYVYNLTEDDGETSNDALLPEKVYTFTATLKEDRWACTNVFSSEGRLYSGNVSDISGNTYQGLFFKWGSLQGISPVSNWANGSTKVYPMGNLTGTYTYNQVPYDQGTADLTGVNTETSTGDVCTDIHPNWRLPSKEEWQALLEAGTPENINGSEDNTSVEEGTGSFYDGVLLDNLVYLPKSGYIGSDEILTNVATDIRYWSKTVYGAADAYSLAGSDAENVMTKQAALPIRCIKKLTSELPTE
jgi:uncharacterized protein (TIGR02145 family)